MKGEFMVMLELMQELPGAKEGKEKVKIYVTITFFITKAALIALRELDSYTVKGAEQLYLSKSLRPYGIRDTCPELHFVQYIKA